MEEKITKIVADAIGCSPQEIKPDANLETEFGMDSLDAVEIIMEVEEEFDIEIPDEDATTLKTVNQIVEYVSKNRG